MCDESRHGTAVAVCVHTSLNNGVRKNEEKRRLCKPQCKGKWERFGCVLRSKLRRAAECSMLTNESGFMMIGRREWRSQRKTYCGLPRFFHADFLRPTFRSTCESALVLTRSASTAPARFQVLQYSNRTQSRHTRLVGSHNCRPAAPAGSTAVDTKESLGNVTARSPLSSSSRARGS